MPISPRPNTSSRRNFLSASCAVVATLSLGKLAAGQNAPQVPVRPTYTVDPALRRDWLARWEKSILGEAHRRYCDTETGEELGWLVSPFLNGFYYGYRATRDPQWADRLIDWSDAWIKRGIKEPDGHIGWPKADGASTAVMAGLVTDNILGEAMALRPMVLMADAILKTPALAARHADTARRYVGISEDIFTKWDERGCWRQVTDGGVWIVPPFGIDAASGQWTDGYARRKTDGFTLPANKQNLVALWLTAMFDVTRKNIYRQRARQWWQVMKSRIRERENGRFLVWNYWDPAGPWDYKDNHETKHWVGVHPNGGYYAIDTEGMAAAFAHDWVFTRGDIDKLIATNRDFMWDQKVRPAHFGRIDGGAPDPRWKGSPGVLWAALTPYDATLRRIFEDNHDPTSWGGLAATPWYLAGGG